MRFLVDMDGVVVDFINPFFRKLGVKMPEHWPDGEYSPEKLFDLTEEQVWNGIGELWWRQLPKTEEADEIIFHLHTYTDQVYFVTRPQRWAGATAKIKWISDFYPGMANRFILTPHRELLANDDTILIDDQSNNIDLFNAHGGRGILMPRYWNRNKKHMNNAGAWTIQAVDNCVAAMSMGINEISDRSWRV